MANRGVRIIITLCNNNTRRSLTDATYYILTRLKLDDATGQSIQLIKSIAWYLTLCWYSLPDQTFDTELTTRHFSVIEWASSSFQLMSVQHYWTTDKIPYRYLNTLTWQSRNPNPNYYTCISLTEGWDYKSVLELVTRTIGSLKRLSQLSCMTIKIVAWKFSFAW